MPLRTSAPIAAASCAILLGPALPAAAGATASVAPAPRCHGHEATIVGGKHDQFVDGTDGPDVIVVRNNGAPDVYGRAGRDIICGGRGNDFIRGGAGDDLIDGRHGMELLWAGRGDDHVHAGAGNRYGYNASIRGGRGDDHLYGGPKQLGEVMYDGRARGIRMKGHVVHIGDETDHLHRVRYVYGSRHDDVMIGTGGRDILLGARGKDRIDGRGGNDRIDWRIGFKGGDTILGGSGRDLVGAWFGDDEVDAGAGDDRVVGLRGDDSYDGGPGVDKLTAAESIDLRVNVARGHATGLTTHIDFQGFEVYKTAGGDDTIIGDDRDNVLLAGGGDDSVDGRGGTDRCKAETVVNCER